MELTTAYCTDRGNVKAINQDALLIKTASSRFGSIIFMAVCDGMGGLEQGEVASSTMIKHLSDWFNQELPGILRIQPYEESICDSLNALIDKVNQQLMEYGKDSGIKLGTTLTAMLVLAEEYIVVHVGDTRLYEISNEIRQITVDQTLVAKEVEMNRLSPKEAEHDPRSHILLQCIGASKHLEPEFLLGRLKEKTVYIICCDGFRHKITKEEMKQEFGTIVPKREDLLFEQCRNLVRLNMERGEKDNITVVALQCV
ncbi:MAG: protein phosphatase 2C domain-containing protein [Roseburia sp.]|nr:protein phosphatase 2C domain-containing protein [Roseburia sp.]MCM1278640.1 protein phosphatase 2C domain-containing protein [Robinsoniella sp.]